MHNSNALLAHRQLSYHHPLAKRATRVRQMSRLFNTTIYAPMNDVSVTSGNADGWVVLEREPIVIPARATVANRSREVAEKRTATRAQKSRA
jgi:hypothetical protein